MNVEPLVAMANQIGAALATEAEIANHLKRFWAPRMREALLRHVDGGGAGLAPNVLRAVREHRQML